MIRIQAAGIGQHPETCRRDALRLTPHHCIRPSESGSVRADADHRNPSRRKPPDLALQPSASGSELSWREFGGRRRRSCHQVGDAQAVVEQQGFFPWTNQPRGKPGGMECGPEAVAWAGEVMSGRGGVETGINPAEEDLEAGPGQIGDGAADGARNVGLSRPLHQSRPWAARWVPPPGGPARRARCRLVLLLSEGRVRAGVRAQRSARPSTPGAGAPVGSTAGG